MVAAGFAEVAARELGQTATIHRERNASSARSESHGKLSSEILSKELRLIRSSCRFKNRSGYGQAPRGLYMGTSGRFVGSRSKAGAKLDFSWESQAQGHLRYGSVI